MTANTKVTRALKKLEAVHGWEGLVEVWIDKYGIQRIECKYRLDSDPQDREFRSHCVVERMNTKVTDAELMIEFADKCVEGLED